MGSQVRDWFTGQGANPGRRGGESCTIPPQDAQDDTVPCCLPTLSIRRDPLCLQFTNQARLFGRKKKKQRELKVKRNHLGKS